MRVFLIMAVFFTVLMGVMGQSSYQDSLLKAAQSNKTHESVMAYKSLAMSYRKSLDTFIMYSTQGLQLARDINDDHGEANLQMNLGVLHDIKGFTQKAITYYNSAEAIWIRIGGYDDWLTSLYINYGAVYYYSGNKGLALEYWLKAYNKSTKDIQDENYSYLLNNIALAYDDIGKPQEALLYYKRSLKLKRNRKDSSGYYNSERNIANVFLDLELVDSAMLYINNSISGFEELGEKKNVVVSKVILADILLHKKEPNTAFNKMAQVLEEIETLSETRRIEAYKVRVEIAKEQELWSSGIKTIEKLLGLIYQHKRYNHLVEALRLKSYFLAKLNRPISALKLQLEADSVAQINTKKSRLYFEEEMQVKFNIAQKEAENQKLQAEGVIQQLKLSRFKRNMVFAIISLIGLSLFTWFVYKNKRRVQKFNSKLEHQNKIIEKSLHEKEFLLKEIHHRVKNNLQVISSLLKLQSKSITDEKAQLALDEGRSRVRSMALIHQNLYQEDNLSGIKAKRYFEELIGELVDTYGVNKDKISIIVEIQDIVLDVETLVPLGLITNELITNVFKYAFDKKGTGIVSVLLKEENHELHFSVKDNGRGYDPALVRPKSFGLRLIKAFVNRLRAEYTVISEHGTQSNLIIKDYKSMG